MYEVMTMPKLKFSRNEVIMPSGDKIKRYPNLSTVIMVEDFLHKNHETPITVPELKRKLPKQVMHQTLQVILAYLFKSGKIIYGPRGIQWIYSEPEHIKRMMKNSVEI